MGQAGFETVSCAGFPYRKGVRLELRGIVTAAISANWYRQSGRFEILVLGFFHANLCIHMSATNNRFLQLASAAVFSAFASAAVLVADHHKSVLPDVIEVGQRPESITKGFDGDFFVTVMNGKEAGDGVIKRIHGSEVTVFARGFDEPKGICFVGGFLFATDLNKVRRIDKKGKVTILAEGNDFPKVVSYLNDAAAGSDGKSIYITDMGANTKMHGPNGKLWPFGSEEARAFQSIGRVYRIGLDGKVSIAIDANPLMPCPNGVGVGKDGQLMVGAFFTGNLLELRDGELIVVADSFRGADAVEQDSEGNYFVSSWKQGRAWKVAADGKSSQVVIDGLLSAADFYLDEANSRLLVPDMLAGTVNVAKY